jgi:hypothetical protein
MSIGRPKKNRNANTGEKLLHALKLSGLTWGNKTSLPNHVLNTKRWIQFELPKSTNTLVGDIKNGIPSDRLTKYSNFFDVDPMLFIDDDIQPYSKKFECEILQRKHKITTNVKFPVIDVDKMFCHVLHDQNDHDKNIKLYEAISGVYLIYLKELRSNIIAKSVVHVHSYNNSFIIADGYLKYLDIDILFNSILFKWSTFLHINYYTQNCSIVGYMIAQDPTCLPYSLYKDPLTLELYGLAGSITSPSVPDRFHGFAEKQKIPEHISQTDYYLELCNCVSTSPVMDASSPEYEKIRSRIVAIQDKSPMP